MGSDVRLTSGATVIPLRIATDPESKALAYREENVIGPDLVNPADGQKFLDVFDTWHLGGFIEEHVQNGFYREAVNVDCTTPGEIKPGPGRLATVDVAKDTDKTHWGVRGLSHDLYNDRIFVVVASRPAAAAGAILGPERIYTRFVDSAHAAADGIDLTTDASDVVGAAHGYSSKADPLVLPVSTARTDYLVPVGDAYVHVTDSDSIIATVAVPCHALQVAGNRIFKASIAVTGEAGLSNMDRAADVDASGSWTTPVDLGVFEDNPVGVSLGAEGLVPFLAVSQGLFFLGPGGAPFNILPRAGVGVWKQYALYPATPVSGGTAVGAVGAGRIFWFSAARGVEVGPSVSPLTNPPYTKIMHMQESPGGDLWVLVWTPDTATADGVWEMWVGKRVPGVPVGPTSYRWHQVLRDVSASEGGPDNDAIVTGPGTAAKRLVTHGLPRPFLPVWFPSTSSGGTPAQEIAIATGHSPQDAEGTANAAVTTTTGPPGTLTDTRESWTTNEWAGFTVTCNSKTMEVVSNTATVLTGTSGWSGGGNPGNGNAWQITLGRARLTFVDGGLFYHQDGYTHEDGGAYTVTVQWRSGRYSRQDRRVDRHWTQLRFLGKNINAAASDGGRIRVEVSFDGGAFEDPPGGSSVFLTGNDQTVSLDTISRDIEVRLTWQLDGASTMDTAPATVTEIHYVGREVPPILRRLNFVAEGTSPQQAGGVRRHEAASDLYSTLVNLVDDAKMTFVDPFGVSRTVIMLPVQLLTAGEVHGVMVPEGAIGVSLLEVPA